MTHAEKQNLLNMTIEPAQEELIKLVENIILQKTINSGGTNKLNPTQTGDFASKLEFWLMAFMNKGYITAIDQIMNMAEKTLEVTEEPELHVLPDAAQPAPDA